MSALIEAALGVLTGFRSEVTTWTNQGVIKSIDDHIATIKNAAEQDVHAGETAVKAVFAELYGAFHGHEVTPVTDTPAPVAPVVEPTPAPATPAAPVVAPVAADPTPASSTTVEASSAPSSTPSTSATETPAAPAAPAAPAV